MIGQCKGFSTLHFYDAYIPNGALCLANAYLFLARGKKDEFEKAKDTTRNVASVD